MRYVLNPITGKLDLIDVTSGEWGAIVGTLSDQTDLQTALNTKQASLISGTNIKTINGSLILGSGNLSVGTVTSVSGTTNRITSTGGTTPVIDISGSYVGQSSITTVGTLTNLTVTNAPIFSAMTAGSVLFAGTAGLLSQNNSQFFWDDTNKNLGIHNAVPDGAIDVIETRTDDFKRGIISRQQSDNINGAVIMQMKSRGTPSSPTIPLIGDTLSNWISASYDGNSFIHVNEIRSIIDGTPGANSVPTGMGIFTGDSNGGTNAFWVASNHNIGIGHSFLDGNPPIYNLDISGFNQENSLTAPTGILSLNTSGSDVALNSGVFDNGDGDNPIIYSWTQSRSYNTGAINYPYVLQPSGGNVGIGMQPTAKLDVAETSGDLFRGIRSFQFSDDQNPGLISGYKARGTPTAPTTVLSGDVLFDFLAGGYDGSNFIHTGQLQFYSDGTVDTGSISTAFRIATGTAGGGSNRFTILGSGEVGIATDTPTRQFDVNGESRFRGKIFDQTNVSGSSGDIFTNNGSGGAWKAPLAAGLTSILASSDQTNKSAAVTATTIATPSATGMYRLSIYLQLTQAASVSSVLGGTTGVVITYNDGDGNVAQTDTMGLFAPNGTVVSTINTNTTATNLSGSIEIYAKTGVAIKYAIDYTSVGVTPMKYSYHVRLEAI